MIMMGTYQHSFQSIDIKELDIYVVKYLPQNIGRFLFIFTYCKKTIWGTLFGDLRWHYRFWNPIAFTLTHSQCLVRQYLGESLP